MKKILEKMYFCSQRYYQLQWTYEAHIRFKFNVERVFTWLVGCTQRWSNRRQKSCTVKTKTFTTTSLQRNWRVPSYNKPPAFYHSKVRRPLLFRVWINEKKKGVLGMESANLFYRQVVNVRHIFDYNILSWSTYTLEFVLLKLISFLN